MYMPIQFYNYITTVENGEYLDIPNQIYYEADIWSLGCVYAEIFFTINPLY